MGQHKKSVLTKFWPLALVTSLTLPALAEQRPSNPQPASQLPASMAGAYTISLSGLKVGDFYFQSKLENNRYTLFGDARISALMGSVKWKGKATAVGTTDGNTVSPAQYRMNFNAPRRKSGALTMSYANDAITRIDMQPPNHPAPDVIPLHPRHLKGTFDPLTAMISLAVSSNQNPCKRRISVFDGKIRFDLELSYLRRAPLPTSKGSRTTDLATVCAVRFVPIAGYRNDKSAKAMTTARGIEVWLRDVPGTTLVIPHHIRVPTYAGHVTVNARRVDIVERNKRQIALVN